MNTKQLWAEVARLKSENENISELGRKSLNEANSELSKIKELLEKSVDLGNKIQSELFEAKADLTTLSGFLESKSKRYDTMMQAYENLLNDYNSVVNKWWYKLFTFFN